MSSKCTIAEHMSLCMTFSLLIIIIIIIIIIISIILLLLLLLVELFFNMYWYCGREREVQITSTVVFASC